ncbi:hypothetical protein MGYG_08891 [Nannizzia gypsea CBS 118893]|uniref:Uncharacterized protein n=1 Tax=Arthroderma gypseum (strain ATCC MYA-4604 / CBS 118893) TaxID=535722 RepID=E5QZ82_ARTGP|nr:hypothetical protein MGYG_08891 [Nannizzia gypsea CBS 118893]EFQ97314.1 hypothetical protein MGYG_08891 [Nannizzia gypsea CBS 118893]
MDEPTNDGRQGEDKERDTSRGLTAAKPGIFLATRQDRRTDGDEDEDEGKRPRGRAVLLHRGRQTGAHSSSLPICRCWDPGQREPEPEGERGRQRLDFRPRSRLREETLRD